MGRMQALIGIACTFCLSTYANLALTENYNEELGIPVYPNSKTSVHVYLFGSETPMHTLFERFIDINKQNFLYTITSSVKANFSLETFEGAANPSNFFLEQCSLNVYLLDGSHGYDRHVVNVLTEKRNYSRANYEHSTFIFIVLKFVEEQQIYIASTTSSKVFFPHSSTRLQQILSQRFIFLHKPVDFLML